MKLWNDHFHGPVAAVRPYLLLRCVLLLLGFDVFIAMSPHSAIYGTAGFNVAHFTWLDALQPVPTPGYHLAFLLFSGLLAITIALGAVHRLLLLLLFVTYTYAWCMSRLDSYTHHYLLSLVLFAFIFFPHFDARELFAPHAESDARARPRTSAWGYTLLGTTAGIVFFWCAMAKVDPTWRAGHTLLAMGGPSKLYQPLEELAAQVGISHDLFWRVLSTSVIGLELALAACYLVALRQDRSNSFLVHAICALGWVLAVALHVGNEFLDLSIRWFSYHMLIIASVFFLPERVLLVVARLGSWPGRRLHEIRSRIDHNKSTTRTRVAHVLCGVAVAALCFWLGSAVDLPGAVVACGGLGVIAVGWTMSDRLQEEVPARLMATSGAVVILYLSVSLSTTRETFYARLADDLSLIRRHDAAVEAYTRAERYARTPESEARFRSELGNLLEERGESDAALSHLRAVVASYPDLATPYYNLARALKRRGETEQAHEHYRTALQLQPDFPKAHTNLGNLLLEVGNVEAAIRHYRQALASDPELAPAHNNLGNALRGQGKLDEALTHYRQALRLEPFLASAHANLGQALFDGGETVEAATALRRALRIEPDHGAAHAALGALLRAQGAPAQARRHLREALRLSPDSAAPALELARLLATHPAAEHRDPAEALRLAQQAIEGGAGSDPSALDTLAAAYAAGGDFTNAVAIVRRAITRAQATRQRTLQRELRQRLQSYRRGEPYRETPETRDDVP